MLVFESLKQIPIFSKMRLQKQNKVCCLVGKTAMCERAHSICCARAASLGRVVDSDKHLSLVIYRILNVNDGGRSSQKSKLWNSFHYFTLKKCYSSK